MATAEWCASPVTPAPRATPTERCVDALRVAPARSAPPVESTDPAATPSATPPVDRAARAVSRGRPPRTAPAGRRATPTDGPPSGYVTAEMIAERLARITGKTSIPASTIRGMASRDQMPAPTDLKWGRRTLWDAGEIDRWLEEREARHVSEPTVRQIQRRLTELDEHARRTGNDLRLKEGVREAHRRGLSYQQIADAIRVKNGDHHPTREAVRVRFRHYL
ncbi:helix-turn-helix transcriptional regulator [Mobilicoccus pelagius]|uniref:Uncharacterized protein n=1 Tax=Mobilicoccus pelagius NBRC 104925 TaxID=1089455 RepID=H5UVH6_9MICO|nr:hypothetical protein [Mobilicoccus pelagius]GAB49734.1 hypothetical protein MOPEL_134_00180 [Mobilicoccus pelagius NBRC 104925]